MMTSTTYTVKREGHFVCEVLYYGLAVEIAERELRNPGQPFQTLPGSVTVWNSEGEKPAS